MEVQIILEAHKGATPNGEAFDVDIKGLATNRAEAHAILDKALDAMDVQKDD